MAIKVDAGGDPRRAPELQPESDWTLDLLATVLARDGASEPGTAAAQRRRAAGAGAGA